MRFGITLALLAARFEVGRLAFRLGQELLDVTTDQVHFFQLREFPVLEHDLKPRLALVLRFPQDFLDFKRRPKNTFVSVQKVLLLADPERVLVDLRSVELDQPLFVGKTPFWDFSEASSRVRAVVVRVALLAKITLLFLFFVLFFVFFSF